VAPVDAPEEVKQAELTEKQLKILGILQARSSEYMDAINYAQQTLKSKPAVMALLATAEKIKKLEEKVKQGGNLTKEEILEAKAVSAETLFGVNEQGRIAKLNEVYQEI